MLTASEVATNWCHLSSPVKHVVCADAEAPAPTNVPLLAEQFGQIDVLTEVAFDGLSPAMAEHPSLICPLQLSSNAVLHDSVAPAFTAALLSLQSPEVPAVAVYPAPGEVQLLVEET
jgi:hypothetical protein